MDTVHKDTETAERVGASGTFQISNVLDENDKDHAYKCDQGQHWHAEADCKAHVADCLGCSLTDVYFADEDDGRT